MTGHRRVDAASPPKLAVVVDGREHPVQAPDHLQTTTRWDLVVEDPNGAVAVLRGDTDINPDPPEGHKLLAKIAVQRGMPVVYSSNITSPEDQPADPALPPYTGRDVRCPKCGQHGASTRFLIHGHCIHPSELILGWAPNERLHRECDSCGYVWDEATVEQKQPVVEETAE